MTATITRRSTSTLHHGDRNLDLSQAPCEGIEPIVRILDNGHAVVGYLSYDQDCPHPLNDNDGMGRIFSSHKHGPRGDLEKMRQALGLDQCGDPIPGCKPNPMAVFLSCYSHGGEVWAVAGSMRASMFPDQQWDVAHGAGIWVPDESCVEHIEEMGIVHLLPEGSKVEHSSNRITYTLPDGRTAGGFHSYRQAAMAALKVLDLRLSCFTKEQRRQALRAATVECAEGALEQYNAWLAGDCYCVCVDVFDPDDQPVEQESDSCGGYIGSEYAEQELKDQVRHSVERLEKTQ